ncbi:MAG: alpha/beta fold hydrolase [Gemmatimonadaceae bacterium]
MHAVTRLCRPSFLVALAAALAMAACADDLRLPTAADDPPGEQAAATGVLRDGGIDRTDTHFAVNVTTDGGEEMTATLVAGDAEVSDLAPPPGDAYVEAGYGTQGELRFGVYWSQPSAGVSGIRVVGDQLEMLDEFGSVMLTRTFDQHMAATGFPGGSLVGAILTTAPPDDGCTSPDGWCAFSVADGAAGDGGAQGAPTARRSTTVVGDVREDRVRLRPGPTRVALSGEADRADIVQRYRRVASGASRRAAEAAGPVVWRLAEVEREVRATTDHGEEVTRARTRLAYRAWHTNASRDAARVASRAAARATARQAARAAAPSPATGGPARHELPDVELAAFSPSVADQTLGESICPRGTTDVVEFSKSTRGLTLLYQHGFCGNANVFEGMRPRIAAELPVVGTRAFSLSSTDRLDAQVTDLAARIASVGGGQHYAIGHSQGGLLIRRLGQRHPDYVSGVITVASPHLGTYVADLPAEFVADLLIHAVGPHCLTQFMCDYLREIIRQTIAARIGYGALSAAVPALEDLRTGSPFLESLNATYESFKRTGIEVSISRRWALARMLGDQNTPRTRLLNDGRPDGEQWARAAEEVYRAGLFLQYMAIFADWVVSPTGGGVSCSQPGYATFWEPCYDLDYGHYWFASWYDAYIRWTLYFLGSIVTTTMDRMDWVWDYITTRNGDGTDGFIQLSSQRYPPVPGAFPVTRLRVEGKDADSHAGITASPATLQRTLDALRLMTGLAQ